MNTDEQRSELNKITEFVIGCAMTVSNTLGCGFLEKVYENAIAVELRRAELKVEQQRELLVHYTGVLVGSFAMDLVIEDRVIVELKAVEAICDAHVAQCLNYLRAAELPVCLLLNFGSPRLEVRRFVR